MEGSDNKAAGPGKDRGWKAAPASSLVHGPDVKVALVILAICAVLYYVTTTWETVPALLAQNIPPEWFPRLMIWTIVVLTLFLPFEHHFLQHGKKGLDEDRTERIPPMAIVTAGLLILVVVSVVVFGTFLATIFVCAALPLLWGERRWKVLIPYVILFPTAVAFLFTQVLEVYFEPGWFGFEI